MYHDVTNLKFKKRRNEGQPEQKGRQASDSRTVSFKCIVTPVTNLSECVTYFPVLLSEGSKVNLRGL
jgi:hypothetical protein